MSFEPAFRVGERWELEAHESFLGVMLRSRVPHRVPPVWPLVPGENARKKKVERLNGEVMMRC